MSSEAAARQRRTTRIVLVVLALASAAPLFAPAHLPFTDVPEHVAVISALQHWHTPAFRIQEHYALSVGSSQYLLFHAVGFALATFVGDAELATRLLLACSALALPFTLAALLRALGRDERLAFFAPFLFWNRALTVGFLPFVASFPLMIGTLALAVRHARAPRAPREVGTRSKRRFVALALLATALFYLHLSTYLLLVAMAVPLTVMVGRFEGRAGPASARPAGRRAVLALLREAAARLSWTLPSLAFAALWMSRARLAVQSASLGGPGEIERMRLTRALHALPLWASDIFVSHGDEVCSVLWWSAYIVIAVTGASFMRRRMFLVSAAPLAVAMAAYLLTPFQVGAGGMLNVRLAPVVALLALLPLRPVRSAWGKGGLAVAALAGVAMSWNAAREMRASVEEELGDFDGTVVAATTEGARVLTLPFELRSKHMLFPPWLHVGAYHRVAKGGVSSFSFSELPHWPLAFRASAAPPKQKAAFWEFDPCTYRNAVEGWYYDFVLVRGDVDPFADEPPGPVFRAVASTRDFVLYGKVAGATWPAWDEDDRGPCHRRGSGPVQALP